MDDNQPSTSSSKQTKCRVKNTNKLSEEELEYFITHPSSEDDFCESEDDYNPSNEEDISEESEDDFVETFDLNDENEATVKNQLENVTVHQDNWCDDTIMKNISFTERSRLLVENPESGLAIDYFYLIADAKFFQLIVENTNKYAEEVFLKGVNEKSRITSWKDVTVSELKTFFGLLLHMGTWRTNRLQDYWKSDNLFNLRCFPNNMSRDRFLLILRCLHFCENPGPGQTIEDRVYKIRPLIDFFTNKMNKIYQPGKNLSLDESMVLWRGRLSFRIYIKNKRHKYGIKLYVLTEPEGLVLNMSVYTGALDAIGGKGHSKKVVLDLMKNKLNSGHALFMDNFYISVDLAKELLEKKNILYRYITVQQER